MWAAALLAVVARAVAGLVVVGMAAVVQAVVQLGEAELAAAQPAEAEVEVGGSAAHLLVGLATEEATRAMEEEEGVVVPLVTALPALVRKAEGAMAVAAAEAVALVVANTVQAVWVVRGMEEDATAASTAGAGAQPEGIQAAEAREVVVTAVVGMVGVGMAEAVEG